MKLLSGALLAFWLVVSLQAQEITQGVIGGTDIAVSVETNKPLQIGENQFLIRLTQGSEPLVGAELEVRTFKPNHGPQMPARDFRADAQEVGLGLYEVTLPLDHKCGTWRFGLGISKEGQRLGAYRAPMPFI